MLYQENSKLREDFEELQHQMLSAHVQEGRRLVQSGASIAQEIEDLPRDEVRNRLPFLDFWCLSGSLDYSWQLAVCYGFSKARVGARHSCVFSASSC